MTSVHFIPRPNSDALSSLDFSQLERLKAGISLGGSKQHKSEAEVAQQFEALVMQQLLKQVRNSSAGTIFDSEQSKMAQSMADDQLALQLSNPGVGLAQALLEQIQSFNNSQNPSTNNQVVYNTSRLPHLRSDLGSITDSSANNKDLPIASSISELIQVLTKPVKAIERVVGPARGSPNHIKEFVNKMSDAAHKASAQSGVPAPLILSQAALESGWGKREIIGEDGTNSHNLFGIKATGGWKGKVAHIMTTEYENGTPKKVMQPFRAYDSYADSFADYAKLIGTNGRYSNVITAPSAEAAAYEIQKAGYATDPSYADKLISIMGYFHKTNGILPTQSSTNIAASMP